MKQISFHGKQENKDAVLADIAKHEEMDAYIKGVYWDEIQQKGCAIGCLIKSGNHADYEEKFGIPKWLARLEDRIFEGLDIKESKKWPRRFMEAMPIGMDGKYFDAVFRYIAIKRIDSTPEIVDEACKQAVANIRQLHVTNEQDSAVWSAASLAASSAARANSAASSAANSAARLAASLAEGLAESLAEGLVASLAACSAESLAEGLVESSADYLGESNRLIEALNLTYDELKSAFIETKTV